MSVSEAAPAAKVASPQKVIVIDSVECYAHGQGLLLYPLFVVPLLLWGATSIGFDGRSAAWIWFATLIIVLAALSWNFSRIAAWFVAMLFALLTLSAFLAKSELGIPAFPWMGRQLSAIPISWSPDVQGAVYSIAAVSALFFVIEIISSRIDGLWEFDKNEFNHTSWDRKNTTFARGQNTIVTLIPCVLKSWLLFGGATLQITGAQDQQAHAVIEHVVRGKRVGARIRKMLESLRVTNDSGVVR